MQYRIKTDKTLAQICTLNVHNHQDNHMSMKLIKTERELFFYQFAFINLF